MQRSHVVIHAMAIHFILIMLTPTALSAQGRLVDQPPGPRNLPYQPADGEQVQVNPPPFIWVPAKGAVAYRLEVARNGECKGDDVIRLETDVSTAALGQTLASGTWHWRYGAVLAGGKVVFSRSRRFTVSADALPFPFPDLDKVVAGIPRAHPRLFFPDADLAKLRREVAASRKSDLDRLLRASARCFNEKLVPEPPYVQGKGAERGRNYMQIFRATRPPMDRMETCALAYLLSGESAHGLEAKRRILHFFSWDPEGPTAYKHNDEPAMWVMMRGIRAYDWIRPLFSEAERARVEKSMRTRARQFYDHLKKRRRFHTDPFESHAGRTLGFLGEASLAFIHEWPEAREYLRYVLTLFWNVYPAWGKTDGGWHEGPSYWSYYMSFALHFVVPLKKLTGINLAGKPFFRNTPYYKLYTNPPYARISPFGDGEHAAPSRSMGTLMHWFGALHQDPYFLWYSEAKKAGPGTGPIGFALPGNGLTPKPPRDLPASRYFPGVGLVSMHTALGDAVNDIHLLFHSDPYGAISHAHADQNAFTLEAFGEALAIASGYYPWYGSDHHRNWQWHSRSSNTITFDGGEGQTIRSAASRGRIVTFHGGKHYDYTLGDATAAYGGKLTRALRHVLHLRPGVFLIVDDLASKTPRRFEWQLHAFEKMAVDTDGGMVTIRRGGARLRVMFLRPQALTFSQRGKLPWPSEDGKPAQSHVTASTREKLNACQFVVALLPYKENSHALPPKLTCEARANGVGVMIQADGKAYTAFFKKEGAPDPIKFRGMESDGQMAVTEKSGEKTLSTFQSGGSYVR